MSDKINKHSKSILYEISNYVPKKNKEMLIETKAAHVITSAINILEMIAEHYSEEEAEQLTRRFISSIKGRDPSRFSRSINKFKET